ncbi:MAG: HD-GYP domain-containing protein, partial [Treponema sp.]|nr:HD-GYP domain-containing protein [Treponema sp.]
MKTLAIKDIQEGTIFSAPVYVEGNNLFVPAGVAVKKKDIARLQSWGVESVETEGHPIDASAAGAAKRSAAETPSVVSLSDVHENKGAYRSYMDLIERLDELCLNISSAVAVEARSIDNITSRILQAVRDQRHSFIG